MRKWKDSRLWMALVKQHPIFWVVTLALTGLFGAGTSKGKVIPEPWETAVPQEEAVVSQETVLDLSQPLKCLQAPPSVAVGESVPIKALLLDENLRPIVMQPVLFTCDSGSFEFPVLVDSQITYHSGAQFTGYTDGFGEAEVFWRAPQTPGLAKVTVWYFGPEEGQICSLEAMIEVSDDPDLHRVSLECVPARMTLENSEDEFVGLVVEVTDRQGSPIAGEPVLLQTTLGELGQYVVENVKGEGKLLLKKSNPFLLVTDEDGREEVLLFPPPSPGIATITATTSNGQARVFYLFTSAEGLHLTSDSYAAVGDDGALIIARLDDASGKPIAGQVVTFQTTLGQLSATQAVTDENGEAPVVLTGNGVEGTAVVTATALGYSARIYVDVFNESSDYSRHELPTFLAISRQPPLSRFQITVLSDKPELTLATITRYLVLSRHLSLLPTNSPTGSEVNQATRFWSITTSSLSLGGYLTFLQTGKLPIAPTVSARMLTSVMLMNYHRI
jgi:hypothetical protein